MFAAVKGIASQKENIGRGNRTKGARCMMKRGSRISRDNIERYLPTLMMSEEHKRETDSRGLKPLSP